ncbi:DUF1707 domain-containing protein [Micromonospora sp. HNM0581]|uniref:DUF1707 SHOCT-like domain-containing protein n=1 Tax=Micromonospora sp. HNM0581 TaxID=2716341 RepID=UPI00146E7816|nr:DUF1707 domain-containing protein [Micromonospora sp. HNM0581]NLU77069.1 DUF1707 domain-containing protein [Micromonospora sp. HNM0581]
MDERDVMRAADVDRQAVAEQLRVALDEGRLDLHEYDDRLQQTYAARTYADLDALVSDLPAPSGVVLPTPRSGGEAVPAEAGRGMAVRWLVKVWKPWLRAVGIVVAVWAVTSLAAGGGSVAGRAAEGGTGEGRVADGDGGIRDDAGVETSEPGWPRNRGDLG